MPSDLYSPDDQTSRLAREDALSFVVCLSDDAVIKANLMASPDFNRYAPHEVIATRRAPSAAAGLSMGIAWARNELVVCVYQDVYRPAGWDRLMLNQYRMAERRFGPIGVAGVYGVGPVADADGPGRGSAGDAGGLAARRIGWVDGAGASLGVGADCRVGSKIFHHRVTEDTEKDDDGNC